MTRILLLLFAVNNVLLVISHFLLLFFFQSSVILCSLCFTHIFLLSALVHSSPLLQQKGTVVWSEWWWGRTLTISRCSPSDELLMTSLHLWDERTSEVLFTHPLLSAHPIIFFSLSLFSFELYLLIVLLPVKGIKGPAPPSASAQNPPIEIYLIAIRMRMTCQMTDSERVSKEYGSYLKPDSFDSSFGQWIS